MSMTSKRPASRAIPTAGGQEGQASLIRARQHSDALTNQFLDLVNHFVAGNNDRIAGQNDFAGVAGRHGRSFLPRPSV